MTLLAQVKMTDLPVMKIVGIGMVVYFVLSIAVLWAYARTRLYPLYLLKILWVGFTFVGLIWLISMSCADPGPKHGGVVSEYMKNPAGPFAALGDYPAASRQIYGFSPWWLFMLIGLLIFWRGLVGHSQAQRDSERQRRFARCFLTVTAALLAAVLLAIGGREEGWAGRLVGMACLAGACVLWAVVPKDLKRRASLPLIGAMAVAAAVPLVVALARFNWSSYTYGVSNYTFAWKTARMGNYMLNSVMVSLMTVGITSLAASMAAYSLSRYEARGRNAVLYGFIGAMVIPAQLYIVPLFGMIKDWHVTLGPIDYSFMDSRAGLSLIYAAAGLPFAIFLLTGFYRTLPGTLREAAAIDGCTEWRMFTHVFFPLAAPGMATAAIFQFLGVWNEYQFALVFLTNEKLKTLPVGLYNLSVSQQYAANWSALFAGIAILCLPTFLIFVILQERIVAGLTVGAVKE